MLKLSLVLDVNKEVIFRNYFMSYTEKSLLEFLNDRIERFFNSNLIFDKTKQETFDYLNNYFNLVLSDKKEFKKVIKRLKWQGCFKSVKELKDNTEFNYEKIKKYGLKF